MASWVKDETNAYIQINQLERVYVGLRDFGTGQGWYIIGSTSNNDYALKASFANQNAAQTALDNAIANLGGAI